MELHAAVPALAALAQETRLAVFRLLVRAGPEGLAAGDIGARLGLPASTLSFHLKLLATAGLVRCARRGRNLHYSLDGGTVRELLWFLGEDCLQGRQELCVPPAGRIDASRDGSRPTAGRPLVLFVCSQNSARSQMAEALLRDAAGDRFEVHSAGLRPSAIHPLTLRVLEERGLPTQGLRSKDLGEFLGKRVVHHAIAVCEAAHGECRQLRPFATEQVCWPFPDPAEPTVPARRQLAAFRSVRDAIASRLETWLASHAPPTKATARAASRRGHRTT